MHSPLLTVAIFLGLQASVEGSTFKIQKRSFSVERVANANFAGYNGPRELYKAYRKYNMPIPDHLHAAIKAQNTAAQNKKRLSRKRRGQMTAAGSGGTDTSSSTTGGQPAFSDGAATGNGTAGTGTVAANPEQSDRAYLCPVEIGGQTLNLDFDTGSSDLWVFDSKLPAAQTKGHGVFDPSKSSSFKALDGASWSIQYGDGSGASGTVGTDVVNVGGASFDAQAVELATKISDSFATDTDNDGLLGLAFSSINTVKPQQQQTFFDNIKGSLDAPLFTADLRHSEPGSYTFGAIDKSKFTGDLTYIDIDSSQGFWQFTAGDGQAIADTGTTLILASQSITDDYYKGVDGAKVDSEQGGYTFPCDAKLPDLKLQIGSEYTATVAGEFINLAPIDESGTCKLSFSLPNAGNLPFCYKTQANNLDP